MELKREALLIMLLLASVASGADPQISDSEDEYDPYNYLQDAGNAVGDGARQLVDYAGKLWSKYLSPAQSIPDDEEASDFDFDGYHDDIDYDMLKPSPTNEAALADDLLEDRTDVESAADNSLDAESHLDFSYEDIYDDRDMADLKLMPPESPDEKEADDESLYDVYPSDEENDFSSTVNIQEGLKEREKESESWVRQGDGTYFYKPLLKHVEPPTPKVFAEPEAPKVELKDAELRGEKPKDLPKVPEFQLVLNNLRKTRVASEKQNSPRSGEDEIQPVKPSMVKLSQDPKRIYVVKSKRIFTFPDANPSPFSERNAVAA